MLESIINPKKMERGPLKMFFIGLIYASISTLGVKWAFGNDPVLYEYAGMIVVTFCVMFSLPFMYFLIKQEEEEDEQVEGFFSVWKIHSDAIYAFLWLFLGFIVAFSFWNIAVGDSNLFNAQMETYCAINSPTNIQDCITKYSIESQKMTGSAIKLQRLVAIIENNAIVMVFTLLFSLIFGAGAIFVLAWNASVIAGAIGIFTKYSLSGIPVGLARYMIHGFPEIAAYFITALAGGMFGVSFLRNGFKDKKFLRVIENVVVLLFISIIILIGAAFIEVYFTPILFN
jgi:uncharacterized membrane protein SpoIIM required for sporulation